MTKTAPESSDSETEAAYDMRSPNDSNRARDHMEQLEWLIHMFFEAIRKPCFNVKRLATYIMVERGGYKAIDEAVQWLVRNPFLSLVLFIIFLILLPFILLVGFGVSVIAMTFTGFIVLEGTLLTFVSVLSFGCLGALVIVLTILAAIVLAVYLGFAYIYDMYGNGKISALSNFINTEHHSEPQSEDRNRTNSYLQDQPIDSVGSSSQ